jgi:hypothetical protein
VHYDMALSKADGCPIRSVSSLRPQPNPTAQLQGVNDLDRFSVENDEFSNGVCSRALTALSAYRSFSSISNSSSSSCKAPHTCQLLDIYASLFLDALKKELTLDGWQIALHDAGVFTRTILCSSRTLSSSSSWKP